MDVLFDAFGVILGSSLFLLFGFLWVIALVDIVRSRFREPNEKLIWVIIVLFAPFIGAVIYFLFGRRNRIGTY